MANAWQQVDQIASEALIHLEDSLIVTNLCARDKTSDFNRTADGYAVGSTVRIKTRPAYEAKEFSTEVEVQEIRESARTMSIEKLLDVSVEITAREKAMDMESLIEQFIAPASYALAEKCDRYVASKLLKGAGLYASDDLFASSADMALAKKAATFQQLSPTGRYCLINDTLEAKLLGATFFNTYNNRGESGRRVFDEASLGYAMGMDFYSSLHLPEDTLAAAGTGAAVTNNGTNGIQYNRIGMSTLTVDSVDASTNTFPAGTRIKISGVRRPLIVASLVNGATTTSIPLVDPISEIIPDNAAVTIVGSGETNLEFQGVIMDDQSLAVAMPLLDTPSDKPSFVVNSNGFSIRVTTGYDMKFKKEMMSMDLLIGAELYDPRKVTLLREHA